jgi:hypothetical protein
VSNAAELAAIQAQSEQITMMAIPFVLVGVGIVLGFVMRRKDEGERFRFLPFWICVGIAILGVIGQAQAQESPSVVERFVAEVQAGADFSKGEFAGLMEPVDAVRIATAAKCIPGAPRASSGGGSVMVMWDCSALQGTSSLGTMLNLKDGKITSVFVMSAVIVPTRAQ